VSILKKYFLYPKLSGLPVIMFFITLFSTCEKPVRNVVPDVPVNLTININDPEFLPLQSQNNSVKITSASVGGYDVGYHNNGIIVYNTGDGFLAFDCTCTYKVEDAVSIELTSDGWTGICPECESLYIFSSDGAPSMNSVSVYNLKKYNTSYNPNTGEINIYN